jgi:hypothetical protein
LILASSTGKSRWWRKLPKLLTKRMSILNLDVMANAFSIPATLSSSICPIHLFQHPLIITKAM